MTLLTDRVSLFNPPEEKKLGYFLRGLNNETAKGVARKVCSA